MSLYQVGMALIGILLIVLFVLATFAWWKDTEGGRDDEMYGR